MIKKLLITALLVLLTSVLGYLHFTYPNVYIEKLFYTFLTFLIIYCAFKWLLEGYATSHIADPKIKYSLRRIISILHPVLSVSAAILIWFENDQALVISFGLVGAAIAVALQDVFKNIAGGLVIFFTGTYRVGEWIEIKSKTGEIIDIGLMYTTLLEGGEWVAASQLSGRLSILPNSYVLSEQINNYSKDFNFVWDEIAIPVTYDSDWKKAVIIMTSVAKNQTAELVEGATKSLASLSNKYFYLKKADADPVVFMRLTDNWIELTVRYISEIKSRRLLRSKLSQLILERIQKDGNITISSETITVTNKPVTMGLNDHI